MSSRLPLSVVVPAYNEEGCLASVVQEAMGILPHIGQQFEVLIIDDGSNDGTGAIADHLAEECGSVRVIHHQANQGLGEVYRTGFSEALGEVITFLAADGETPPAYIPYFFERMGEADAVLGFVPQHRTPIKDQMFAACERLVLRALFGPLPRFQGAFMVRRQVISQMQLRSTGRGWSIITELLVNLAWGNYRVLSLPTSTRARLAGQSKVSNWRTAVLMLRETLRLRIILWLGKAPVLAKES